MLGFEVSLFFFSGMRSGGAFVFAKRPKAC